MTEHENTHTSGTVHYILVHSYLIFLFVVLLGVLFDSLFKIKIFTNSLYQYVGFFLLIISSLIIYWAQNTSSNYKNRKLKNDYMSHFEHGPYKYLRNPTHFSLFVMMIGFSLIINSFFSVVFAFIAYALTKVIFLKKEEKVLEKKYGEVYTEYKKKVRNWI